MWWYYGHDAYYEQVLEYELGYPNRSLETGYNRAGSRLPSPERPVPLRWIAAWIAGLFLVSLTLGLASQWLLQ